ncbi:hypothetical protein D3C81_1993960 [compost metagenome]
MSGWAGLGFVLLLLRLPEGKGHRRLGWRWRGEAVWLMAEGARAFARLRRDGGMGAAGLGFLRLDPLIQVTSRIR